MRWIARKLAVTIVLLVGICSNAPGQQLPHVPDLDKEVFTKKDINRLCERDGNRSIVVRRKLAWRLIGVAAPFDDLVEQNELLRHATSDGRPVNAPGTREVIRFVSSGNPFGLDKEYSEEQRRARRRQLPTLEALYLWLEEGHKANKHYKLVGPTSGTDPERYFQDQSAYEIVCVKEREAERPEGGGPGGGVAAALKTVIVRQSVADIGATDLKKAKGARFSYDDDVENGKTSISVEGLVGVVIAGSGADRVEELAGGREADSALYWFKFVPYVYYKSAHKSPSSSKDIDYFSPGITGEYTWINRANTFSFDLQIEASDTIDSAHNSDVYNVGIRFSPSFYDGSKIWLGAPIGWPGSPVLFKPDLSLVARQHFVKDAGTNPELDGVNNYAGIGFDAMMHFYTRAEGAILSKLVGKVGYEYRYNTSGVVDVARFTSGLSYEISNNVTAEINYVSGRDTNTLQQEERWTAGIALKY